jgi:hypothetical protein
LEQVLRTLEQTAERERPTGSPDGGAAREASTWMRVAEVALGVILIAIGVAKLTRAVPIATEIAGTAAKAAIV